MASYIGKVHLMRVYPYAELSEDAPAHTDHWKLAGLCLVVASAGSVLGLVMILVAKFMEGR